MDLTSDFKLLKVEGTVILLSSGTKIQVFVLFQKDFNNDNDDFNIETQDWFEDESQTHMNTNERIHKFTKFLYYNNNSKFLFIDK